MDTLFKILLYRVAAIDSRLLSGDRLLARATFGHRPPGLDRPTTGCGASAITKRVSVNFASGFPAGPALATP